MDDQPRSSVRRPGARLAAAPSACSEELARGAREGSRECFDRLVERHQGSLFRFLSLRCAALEDAEELAQESFLRAWRNLDRYDPRQRFSTWLFTIAARLTISRLRRGRAEALEDQELDRLEARTLSPCDEASQREQDENLWRFTRELLSPDQRSALWLFYVEGLPTAQVAAVLGKRESSARVLLHRARERLRRHLEAGREAAPSVARAPGYAREPAGPGQGPRD